MKKKYLLILFMAFIFTSFLSCNFAGSTNQMSIDRNSSKIKATQPDQSDIYNKDISLKTDTEKKNQPDMNNEMTPKTKISEPIVSGETTAVPWENDDKFKTAMKKDDTFVLMAAYRTVLRDPLPGEEYNVHLAARLLAGTLVKPGEVFSQNEKIGPYTQYRGFQKGPTYIGSQLTTTIGGGVCKIASTLYNVTIFSNLLVIERHPHGMPVPYVPYGQDATVAYGAKDFKFKNNTSFPILIWAQGVDNILYIGFYGKTKPSKVQWHHKMLKVYQAPKVYKINTNLPAGTEKLILEGMDGAVVKSWVTIENPDGTTTTKQLGESYYNPMPHIIEKGK